MGFSVCRLREEIESLTNRKKFLSLGGGVQSTIMLLMSLAGDLAPMMQPFLQILAGKAVYQHLDWLTERCQNELFRPKEPDFFFYFPDFFVPLSIIP
jgi:hypothetical protein